MKGKKLVPEYHNGFQPVAQCAKNKDWLPGLDSNQQPSR